MKRSAPPEKSADQSSSTQQAASCLSDAPEEIIKFAASFYAISPDTWAADRLAGELGIDSDDIPGLIKVAQQAGIRPEPLLALNGWLPMHRRPGGYVHVLKHPGNADLPDDETAAAYTFFIFGASFQRATIKDRRVVA